MGTACLLLAVGCQRATDSNTPERDWRDEVLYFAMIDRLANGDASNDDQGLGEFDPERESHFQGGDLAGVRSVLDGIQQLGATGLWLTPPVLNQWWNPEHTYTGYHGYWASDFEQVDPHFGTFADWRALADDLHARNMLLIQDVVVNHTGDWVKREQGQTHVRARPAAPWLHPDSGVYHTTPAISDYSDSTQRVTYELAGLDDLKTEDRAVRHRLRSIYKWWVEAGGADGFRFDTHKYVEPGFWPAFLEGESGDEGVRAFAERLRGRSFPTFGEVWTHSAPGDSSGELEMRSYLSTSLPGAVDAVLNFPLQESFVRVFSEGMPSEELAFRLNLQARLFDDPGRQLVHFIDNHDMARFRAAAGEKATLLALYSMLTLPGVPVIYQGTEQGDVGPRDHLFDRFDPTTPAFKAVQRAVAWRHAHPTARRGHLVKASTIPGTPLVTWQVAHGTDTVFVLCNPTSQRIVASETSSAMATRSPQPELRVGEVTALYCGAGTALVDAGPHSWMAWTSWLPASGIARPATDTVQAVDGRLSPSDWGVLSGRHMKQDVALSATGEAVALSPPRWDTLEHPRVHLASVEDACGDDRGLSGQIQPPTSPGFAHSMDIQRVELHQEGGHLHASVEMCAPWSTVWSPRFGFDHVAFEVSVWEAGAGVPLLAWRHSGWSLQPLGDSPAPSSKGVRTTGELTWSFAVPDCQECVLRVDTWDADGNGVWRPMRAQPAPYTMGGPAGGESVMDRAEVAFQPLREGLTLPHANTGFHDASH